MKVLFVCSGNKGGVGFVVAEQARTLTQSSVEIEFFEIVGKGILGYLKNVKLLRKKIKANHYDAIHAHYALCAYVASLAGAKNLIVSLMGSDVNAKKSSKYIVRLFNLLFRWKTVIVKSERLHKLVGIKKAVIISNGIDLERFKPMNQKDCQTKLGWNPEHKHILFPANNSRYEKNFPLAERLIAHLNDPKIEIHSFDNTPHHETPFWYNAADLVLMTSIWEGGPNAIKEAMGCCRPIVTTTVGEVVERLAGVDCAYISSITPNATASNAEFIKTAEQIRFLLDSGHQTNGHEKLIADGLSAEIISQKLLNVYA